MRVCLFIGVVLTAFTIVCNAVAVAIPYWLYDSGNVERYQGLWVECTRSDTISDCKYKFLPPEFIDAVRVMMLFGLAFCIISLICAIFYACIKKEKPSLGTAAAILAFVGGVFCLVAVIVYVSKYTILTGRHTYKLHAGFGLAVVTTVSAFLSAMSYCVSHVREEYDD